MKINKSTLFAVWFGWAMIFALSACAPVQTQGQEPSGQPEGPIRSPIAHPPQGPARFVSSSVINGQSDIYIGDVEGNIISQLTNDPARESCPVYSPDGGRVAFCSNRNGSDQLFIMNSDGAGQSLLTDQLPGCLCNSDRPMMWSPDGKWISLACLSGRANQTQIIDLFIIRSDGSKVVNITDSPGYYGGFTWDLDSKSILFIDAKGSPNIYRVNINNKKIASLLDEPIAGIPAGFSPKGDLLIWDGINGTISVILFSKTGGEVKQLTGGSGYDKYPAWSRDGQKIIFMRREGDNNDIYLMNADGSGQVNLTAGSGVANYWPSLSPDGQKIIYLTNSQNQWETMIMNADGSGKTKVTDMFGVVGSISWQP